MDENKNLNDQNGENQQNEQKQDSEKQSRLQKFWPLALIVIIAGVAIMIQKSPCCGLADQTVAPTSGGEEMQSPEISSSLTEIVPESRLAMQSFYGAKSPELAFEDIEGNKASLSEMKDKDVMVVFWATWCPPCRAEVPDLKKLREKMSSDELEIIAISFENKETVENFAENEEINYTVVVSSQNELSSPFKDIRAYPTIMFIDEEGNFRAAVEGGIGLDTMEKIIAL